MTKEYYSPIAIDLGAMHTGVFMAQYEPYVQLKDIEDFSLRTLTLDKYQVLMVDRTARRHQRRGYDRKQLAKRLLKLILENYFCFNMEEHQQAISFLINRRGRILGGDFDPQLLRKFPEEIYVMMKKIDPAKTNKLIGETKLIGGCYDLTYRMNDLVEEAYRSQDGRKDIEELRDFISGYVWLKKDCRDEKKRIEGERKGIEKEKDKADERLGKADEDEEALAKKTEELSSYASLEINPFNFKAKYSEPITENNKTAKEKKEWYAYLLWNICQIFAETVEELKTGHTLRSIYHKQIKEDLKQATNKTINSHHPIANQLATLADAIKNQKSFGPNPDERLDRFANLIGHISNIQLRGLRKYFNNKNCKKGDEWDPVKLDTMYRGWLNSLRPRTPQQREDIKKHKIAMKKEAAVGKSRAINLWLTSLPKETIPPFEDQNNRRPPICQSLLINLSAINRSFPEWRETVKQLIDAYKQRGGVLNSMFSEWSKITREELLVLADRKRAYKKLLIKQAGRNSRAAQSIVISNKDDAYLLRALQFLLDISNRHNQHPILRNIKFASGNKKRNDTEDFLVKHLTKEQHRQCIKFCQEYYEQALRAQQGRVFISDEDRDGLFVICSEKTKHKKYQVGTDFAALFGLTDMEIKELTGIEEGTAVETVTKIEQWLRPFQIQGLTKDCLDLQKKGGSDLKEHIDIALEQQGHKMDYDKELVKIAKKVQKKAQSLAQKIKEQLNRPVDPERFNSVFTFAPIYSIVYDSRSGNAKNCPCCSLDNQGRMLRTAEDVIFAARLPGYSIRPIDGAINKLLDAKARAIAKVKWEQIKKIRAKEVHIPIVIEQNRFDFEKNLKKKKGQPSSQKFAKSRPKQDYMDKVQRIRHAGKEICPYTGEHIYEGQGEIDHIISRATTKRAEQTVVNSEANLIYVSSKANRAKTKEEYRFDNLNPSYLKKIFSGKSEEHEIRPIICERLRLDISKLSRDDNLDRQQLNDIKRESSIFNKFTNFHRLDTEVQQAFRHALFLKSQDPIRRLVEDTLKTSIRARVNGTQRYCAELIAQYIDGFNRVAGNKLNIKYDYFEVAPEYVHELREGFARHDPHFQKGGKQSKQSHAIDALCVFLYLMEMPIMRGENGDKGVNPLALQLPPRIEVPYKDTRFKDKVKDDYFRKFYRGEKEVALINLERKIADDHYFSHLAIYGDGFYAQKFLPVLITGDKEYPIKVGFSSKHSVSVKAEKFLGFLETAIKFSKRDIYITQNNNFRSEKILVDENGLSPSSFEEGDPDRIKEFIKQCQDVIESKGKDYVAVLSIDKRKAQEFMVKELNTRSSNANGRLRRDLKMLQDLGYKTQSCNVKGELAELIKNKKTAKQVMDNIHKKCTVKFGGEDILLPVYRIWESLVFKLESADKQDESKLDKNFRDFFAIKGPMHKHQKARCLYSLPLMNGKGIFLVKRIGWNGEATYQLSNQHDSRAGNSVNYKKPVLIQDGKDKKIGYRISKASTSLKTHYLKWNEKLLDNNGRNIDTTRWYEVKELPQDLPTNIHIKFLAYKIDTHDRPRIRFLVDLSSMEDLDKDMLNDIFNSPYLRYTPPSPKLRGMDMLNDIFNSPYLSPRMNEGKLDKKIEKCSEDLEKIQKQYDTQKASKENHNELEILSDNLKKCLNDLKKLKRLANQEKKLKKTKGNQEKLTRLRNDYSELKSSVEYNSRLTKLRASRAPTINGYLVEWKGASLKNVESLIIKEL